MNLVSIPWVIICRMPVLFKENYEFYTSLIVLIVLQKKKDLIYRCINIDVDTKSVSIVDRRDEWKEKFVTQNDLNVMVLHFPK